MNKNNYISIVFSLLLLLGLTLQIEGTAINARSYDHTEYTRLVFESSTEISFTIEEDERQITMAIDQYITSLNASRVQPDSILIGRITHRSQGGKTYIQIPIKDLYQINNHFVLKRPFRIVFDIGRSKPATQNLLTPQKAESEENIPDAPEQSSISRTQESDNKLDKNNFSTPLKNTIRMICLDPGHGGNNIGSEGSSGILEKDLTLEISKKLHKLISGRLGINVILTRDRDEDVSLNHRAAIANNANANLFISIHINGSYRSSVRGPEIFFASLKATDTRAFNLAEKENKNFINSEDDNSDSKLNMILWNMSQTQHIKESSVLAEAVQEELNLLMHTVNRGVKQAPFRVLMRANMPAILIEVAFLSNPVEEEKLSRDSFLERVALSIYTGIQKYISYYNNRL